MTPIGVSDFLFNTTKKMKSVCVCKCTYINICIYLCIYNQMNNKKKNTLRESLLSSVSAHIGVSHSVPNFCWGFASWILSTGVCFSDRLLCVPHCSLDSSEQPSPSMLHLYLFSPPVQRFPSMLYVPTTCRMASKAVVKHFLYNSAFLLFRWHFLIKLFYF